MADLANKCGYTYYYISRFLKKKTGTNFKELLQKRKLQQACYLLENTILSNDQILENLAMIMEAISIENSKNSISAHRVSIGIFILDWLNNRIV